MTDQVPEQAGWLHYNGQPFSPEAAAAKLAEFDADADRVKAALGGDVSAQQERAAYREMARGRQPGAVPAMPQDEGAVAAQMGERDQMIHESRLDAFAKHVRMTPELRFQMSRRLATQDQSDFAKAERVRLLKDAGFRARVLANDADAVDRWIKITQVAAAPVAPPDYKWEENNG